jgi:thioesterase domain-containing protein
VLCDGGTANRLFVTYLFLQELDCNMHWKEEIRKEQRIRSTALTQHGSWEGRCRREDIVQEALLVGGNHSVDVVEDDAQWI